jgi:outer membrane protein assembly factor BamB
MIRGLDTKTGQVKWEYDIRKDGEQGQFHGDPLVSNDLVVIGTDAAMGHVYAFEKSTGRVRRKYKVAERGVASDVLQLGRNVYAVTLGDELLCLDLETGKPNWTFHSGSRSKDLHWTFTPAITSQRVYFGGLDGIIYALDAQSGKLTWKKELGGRATTSLAVRGHDLYVGTAKRHVYRLDTDSGNVLGDFATESEPNRHLTLVEDSLVVFVGEEILDSLDLSLKSLRWSAEASKEWTSARPYLWQGLVLAGDRREPVAFQSSDGAREWSHKFPETIRGIGTSEEALYVGSLKGPVFACVPRPQPPDFRFWILD